MTQRSIINGTFPSLISKNYAQILRLLCQVERSATTTAIKYVHYRCRFRFLLLLLLLAAALDEDSSVIVFATLITVIEPELSGLFCC